MRKSLKGTFIKMPRDLLTEEELNSPVIWSVYTHLLLMANYKDSAFKGKVIPSGSVVTSLNKLADKTGCTREQIRNTLCTLENAHFITRNTTQSYTLINIEDWGAFQSINEESNTVYNTVATQFTTQKPTPSKEYIRINKNINNNNILAQSHNDTNAIAKLKTNITDEYFYIHEEDIKRYEEYFPSIDIKQEFNYMASWLESNQTNRKTFRGMPRFINNWLTKANDKAKTTNSYSKKEKTTDGGLWNYDR